MTRTMAKGQPDFGLYAPTTTIASISDLGELAARLGSIITFDRRGNVLWYDDFGSGITAWRKSGDPGYAVNWHSEDAKTGGFCCELKTAGATGDFVQIQKYTGYPTLSSMGFEFSFSRKQNWKNLELIVEVQTTTRLYRAWLRYIHASAKFQYEDAAGAFQDVPGISFTAQGSPPSFDTLKLVVDFINEEYIRMLLNAQEINLSGRAIKARDNVATPYMLTAILLTTNTNAVAIGYIDDVIFTQNEP